MFKKITLFSICIFILVGCQSEMDTLKELDDSYVIESNINEQHYQVAFPRLEGVARGYIDNRIRSRIDIDNIEAGLMRLSKDYYSPEEYYFEEGQYIPTDTIKQWLKSGTYDGGLNPFVDEPDEIIDGVNYNAEDIRYISYIHEDNYVTIVDGKKELAAVVIGLVLNPYQAYTTNTGAISYKKQKENMVIDYGKDAAKKIYAKLRDEEDLENADIVIALYLLEEQNSIVPGTYKEVSITKSSDNKLSTFTSYNEQYFLFPSTTLSKYDLDTYNKFDDFKSEITGYFNNYTGVIGRGLYIDESLYKLEVDINIIFNGKSEILGFTQYVADLMNKYLTYNCEIEIIVQSNDGIEAIILKETEDDVPLIHIFN